MSTIAIRDGDRVVLRNVSWELYTELRDDPERDRVRMTYRHGVLELMSPSTPHERINRFLERIIALWCLHHRLPLASFGSTTYRRRDLAAGLEPDSCYYFENEPLVRDREEIDLTIQPPPDLAIEVEITRSAKTRMEIYAELGVPEVWRTNGEWLRMFRLDIGGIYAEISQSVSLPPLNPSDLLKFLSRRGETDETSMMIEFLDWMKAT